MRNTLKFCSMCLLASCLLLFSVPAAAQSPSQLVVKATYSGEGEVSGTSQIYLYLFDSPDIGQGAMPISMMTSARNGADVTFNGLTASTVYLVAAYGDYDPMGPPPSGTPVSFYLPGNPIPTGIPLNEEKVTVEFTFDDSVRMP